MANDKGYLDILDSQVRKNSLKLTKLQEAKIMKTYMELGEDLLKQYQSFNTTVYQKKMIQEKILFYNQQIEKIIEEYATLQAENVVSSHMKVFKEIFKDYEIDKDFLNKFGNIDKECVNYVIKGNLYSNGRGLSKTLWNIGKQQGKNIQDIIIKGRLEGLGAVELGKLLEAYTSKDNGAWKNASKKLGSAYASKITKASVSYEALRLARTVINHTAQVSLMTASKFNPFVDGIQWHTTGSSRMCDLCRAREGVIYPKNQVPFDHPNGMCYQTAVISKSAEQIGSEVGAWARGESNPQLDKWAKELGYDVGGSSASKGSKALITPKIPKATKKINYRTYDDKFDIWDSQISKTSDIYLSKLPENQFKYLEQYTGSLYYPLNEQLRKGEIIEGFENYATGISSALRNYKIPESVVVHRGTTVDAIMGMFPNEDVFNEVYEKYIMGDASQEYLNKHFIGNVVVDKGFMSTSLHSNTSMEKDIQYHINVPEGSQYGAYINDLSKYRDAEFEFLLDKNLALEITAVKCDRYGRLELFLDILGYAD